MQVNKSSWHYRLNLEMTNREYRVQQKNTLCSYFWFTVLNMVKVAFLVTVCVGLLWVFGQLAMGNSDTDMSAPWYIAIPVGLLAVSVFIAFVFGLFFAFQFCMDNFRAYLSKRRANRKPKPVKPDSLITQYVKAKKAKVCPMIEFKD